MQTVVDGVLTNYEVFNPEQVNTLVILHGWGSSLQFWIPIAKQLSPNLRIILLDLPSFGSTAPLPNDPNIPEYTLFVKAFTQKLKLSHFILSGHSFGGQVTLDYALKFPHDLKSIILVSPAVVRERSKSAKFKIILAKVLRPLFSILPKHSFERFLGWYTPRDYSNSTEYQRRVLKKIVVYDLKPFLNQVKIPTDIIWGSEDFVIPYMGKYLAEHILDSHLHVIYGAHHLLYLTHPKKLVDVLSQIIDRLYV
ncbi:hypothetical protein A3K29_00190 [Candidatus Collierbacteria bacterium RIFOXYB2_FULL_46_14]|uniref:AB hydrolase-1 domain-containing protein n=1 Tax=Candidatus Collierbacteria bacterium GW2011_GWA2_46_26 TaxID=1618381 RepID=A0A0G1PLF6_9BACT|nr:MAG: hypothetical protein UW29_C0001G0017 [Candidatus Collierbacteria bacterium GW2011_GWC2_44_13]KKU33609.1 MAG: hypothetical protein UX47_C0002G0017 [Candidatus Collierbacteria bacterium GW2011_GWA2_46_26]OGD72557.1 MAG: hypothetical protein A3K29_00190 [Candidatus Collierbacteria bacterium RIFOXYB2_FULL_46_14]OGD75599.1 MAG: hypothetical protein A3K43_00190 [Candidatus Collierbacteria bacterium RIFOXYA2_FULL_46_20]OGD76935.1 MAG: hypothetical protein A3K39_00190 [Candidatus Collierbacteri